MHLHLKVVEGAVALIAPLSIAVAALAEEKPPPKIDHILLEVADLKKSIAFYHDFLGLEIKSQSGDLPCCNLGTSASFFPPATGIGMRSGRQMCVRAGECIRTSLLWMLPRC